MGTLEEKDKTIDIVAKEFQIGIPAFKKALTRFSKKELVRVISCIIESPLEDKPYVFQDLRSQNLIRIANHLIVCKMIMMQQVYKNKKGETNEQSKGEES